MNSPRSSVRSVGVYTVRGVVHLEIQERSTLRPEVEEDAGVEGSASGRGEAAEGGGFAL